MAGSSGICTYTRGPDIEALLVACTSCGTNKKGDDDGNPMTKPFQLGIVGLLLLRLR